MMHTSALLLLLPLLLLTSEASAYCRAGVDSLGDPCRETEAPRLYWSRGCVTYILHENLIERIPALTDQEIRNIAQASFDAWLAVSCGQAGSFSIQQDPGLTARAPVEFLFDTPNEFVISALSPGEWQEREQSPDAFAITYLWHESKTGEVFDADMALNLAAGDFVRCNLPCRDGRSIDLQNTLTHEAGHVLGLGHSLDPDATMFRDAEPGETFMRDLDTDDEQGLCALDLPVHTCASGRDCTCPAPVALDARSTTDAGCSLAGARGRTSSGLLSLAPLPLLLLGARRFRRRAGQSPDGRRSR